MAESNGKVSTLRLRMDQLEISPRRLAEKVGVTRQRIYQIMAGDSPPTYQTAEKICAVLRCRLIDVFELQDNPKKIIVPRRVGEGELPEILEHFKTRKKLKPTEA